MKTCALYVKGVTPAQSLDSDIAELRKAAARRKFEIVAEYSDRCPFGNARRRGLEALMSDARRQKFEVILVPSLSTLFRSTRELLQFLSDLREGGVGFISVKERLDTSGRRARTAALVLDAIESMENDLHREKVRFGIYLRKLQGFSIGRDPLRVNREALVRDRLSGMSLTRVAKLHQVSRATVVRFTREARRDNNGRV